MLLIGKILKKILKKKQIKPGKSRPACFMIFHDISFMFDGF